MTVLLAHFQVSLGDQGVWVSCRSEDAGQSVQLCDWNGLGHVFCLHSGAWEASQASKLGQPSASSRRAGRAYRQRKLHEIEPRLELALDHARAPAPQTGAHRASGVAGDLGPAGAFTTGSCGEAAWPCCMSRPCACPAAVLFGGVLHDRAWCSSKGCAILETGWGAAEEMAVRQLQWSMP